MMKTVGVIIALAAIWLTLTAAFSIQRSVSCPDTEQGYMAAMDVCRLHVVSQENITCSAYRDVMTCAESLLDACAGAIYWFKEAQLEVSTMRTWEHYFC